MTEALARVATRLPTGAHCDRLAYEILDGPEAGLVYYAIDRPWWLVGRVVVVRYAPADQFARRVD